MDEDWSQVNSGVSDSQHLVVPASQPDSQSHHDLSAHLPALKGKQEEGEGGEQSDSEVVYPVMETGGGQSGSVILVTDSEMEGAERPLVSDDAHIIEETVSEDNPDAAMASSGTNSDDAANITVISRHSAAQQQEEEEPLSQDLFQGKPDDDDRPVSTPSRHMPSLQLSGEAMLVPETVEESLGDQEICPTPEAYGSMPFIIPSTPTLQDVAEGGEKEYNPSEAETLSSQPAQILEAVASLAAETENSCQKQSSAMETGQSGLGGPTMAVDLPEWQQSQSLQLHLTASSSASPQVQTGQPAVQKGPSGDAQQSQGIAGVGSEFGESQNLLLFLSQSQASSQQLSAVRSPPESKGTGSSLSSSRDDSASFPGRGGGVGTRAAMSVGMVQSQSQSASETTFKLERPDVSKLEGKPASQEGGATMNVFQRTRQGKAGAGRVILSEDSDNFSLRAEKTEIAKEGEPSVSDSDPIPCSQKRLQHTPAAQQQSESQTKMEEGDVFNIDTVMDSEPEEEGEGTQSYDVFPALSGKAPPTGARAAARKQQVEQAQVPQLLPSTAPHPHQSLTSQPAARPSRPASHSQPSSLPTGQPSSQPAARHSQPVGQNPRSVAQQGVHSRSQPAGVGGARSSQSQGRAAGGGGPSLETVPENPQSESLLSPLQLSPTIPSVAKSASQRKVASASVVPQEGSQDAAVSQPDPYLFRGSQSQLVEGEGEGGAATTSRADTSVSTLPTTKAKAKSSVDRRRKCLVKKKKELNPRTDTGAKSSSTSTDDRTAPDITKPTRKVRKGQKFTRLQKSPGEFKRPVTPARRKSKDGALLETDPQSLPSQLTVTAQPVTGPPPSGKPPPAPSTSGATLDPTMGGGEEAVIIIKRKSVDFASPLQMGASPQQMSLEGSLSDSQASDIVVVVTKVTKKLIQYEKKVTTIMHFNKDGQVIHEKTSEEVGDEEVIEETVLSKKKRLSVPLSPSRSGSTVTSGDLADISSSSLSNKASSGPGSSLERATSSLELSHPAPLLTAPTALVREHSLGSAGVSPALSFLSPNQSTIERDDSRLDAVVTSSSGGRSSEPLFSADNAAASEVPSAQPPPSSSMSSSSGVVPPSADESRPQKTATPSRSPRKSTRRAPADSSQEGSKAGVKASSPPESQSFRVGAESGGFSVGPSGGRKKGSGSSLDSGDKTLRQHTDTTRTTRTGGSSSSPGTSQPEDVPLSRRQQKSEDTESTGVTTVSKLEIGAGVMCRWKDNFFYPAKFIGLNTGIGNKFKVLFEDGMEKTVRAVDLVMAQNLPMGQSVLVAGSDGICDPGIVVAHVVQGEGEVAYDVAMDDGSTKRCKRTDLLLSEDQASCLLSDEEYKATFGEGDMSIMNTADVSLDNVILGKRLRTKGSPAVGVPRIQKASTSAAPSDDEDNRGDDHNRRASSPKATRAGRSQDGQEATGERTQVGGGASTSKSSARKRKMGPMATSTPTPKQAKTVDKRQTPRKALRESFSPLGAVVVSPETQKRPLRKARVGLFESTKGPMPAQCELFSGLVFMLSHVEKKATVLAEEKRQLRATSGESSTEESTDDGGADLSVVPFDKEHVRAQIEAGGGTVIRQFTTQVGAGKKLYLISSTYTKTLKYIKCLAANIPIVSHQWISHSCAQNQLLAPDAYILPAGISLEKHKLMERVERVSSLAGQRVLLTSSVADFVESWTSILDITGSKVVAKFPNTSAKRQPGVDVVVTDHTCDQSVVDKARQLGVPVVSSEWVMQCIINNTLLKHDAHPKYYHNFFKDVAPLAYQYLQNSA
ncbi:TP53-binding protein 1-like isoform X3 [Littorina saxatilis]|uniref:BRCT domain-containing protein n=1 Tax=Littorina saxatilis TaxID=31220 RepID=A0AAN9C3M5_9CAEN